MSWNARKCVALFVSCRPWRTFSLVSEECLGFLNFRSLDVGILGQVNQLAIVLGGLRAVAGRGSRARNTQEPAVAIGRGLERGLVGNERRGGVSGFE